jgi:hypothetical protein
MTTDAIRKLGISGQTTFSKMHRWGWIKANGDPIDINAHLLGSRHYGSGGGGNGRETNKFGFGRPTSHR